MDAFNKQLAQLAEMFRSLSPAARVAAGLLLGVIVVSLLYLFRYAPTVGDEMLFGGRTFTSRELSAMESAFAKEKLNDYQIVGSRVKVPRSQRHTYVAALASNNSLPDEFHKYIDKDAESSGLLLSSEVQKQRSRQARQKDLGLIISRMNGIEEATVQIDETQKGGLARQKEYVASVAVWAKGKNNLDEEQVRTIRETIASSVAGLKRESVTVTDMNAGRSFVGGGENGLPVAADDPYLVRKGKYERSWRDKIASRLSYIPSVNVEVNVELDPEMHHQQDVIKLDPKVVSLRTSEQSKTSTNSQTSSQGRAGTGSNVNTSAAVAAGPNSNSQVEETNSEQQNVAGQERTVMQKASLVPNRVTASIGIPLAYYAKIWRERNPSTDGQAGKQPDQAEIKRIETEIKKRIEEEVVALFPSRPAGTDVYPQVHVTTFESLTMPEPPATSTSATALFWLSENWQTLAMLLLAGAGLLFFRSLVRSAAPAPSPTAQTAGGASAATGGASGGGGGNAAAAGGGKPNLKIADTGEAGPGAGEAAAKRRFVGGGPNIRDELAGLVKEDPDAAANILRNWIGEAS